MFDINKIYTNPDGKRFLINLDIGSAKTAKIFTAKFSICIRKISIFADLYNKDSTIIIDTPNKETTIEIANYLNEILNQNPL